MSTDAPFDAQALQAALRADLQQAGSPHRAVEQQLYMKSTMAYYGVAVPDVRRIAQALAEKHTPQTVEQWRDACLLIWRGAESARSATSARRGRGSSWPAPGKRPRSFHCTKK